MKTGFYIFSKSELASENKIQISYSKDNFEIQYPIILDGQNVSNPCFFV